MIVLITGASGSICKNLSAKLQENNHQVKFLTANLNKTSNTANTFYWNIECNELDLEALKDVDVIVHLAGANIAKSIWTKERKQLLVDSRVKTTLLLANGLKRLNKTIKKYISAGAIGFYEENALNADESFSQGNDFMADLCVKWENSSRLFDDIAESSALFRTGIVLDSVSGFYAQIAKLAKYYLASVPGFGKQWVSWISMEDIVDMYYNAIIDSSIIGTYNATAAKPAQLSEIIEGIAANENRSVILPNTPKWFLRVIFGELSQVILSSKKILPAKWLSEGRELKHSSIKEVFDSWKK